MGKSSSSPQPVDPYQAAAAQYGLNTGTATYNAGLNRTGVNNPVGSSGWNITGYGPGGGYQIPGGNVPYSFNPSNPYGSGASGIVGGKGAGNANTGTGAAPPGGGGPPLYTFSENLAPGFTAAMQPLDTSQIYGAGPGSPQAGPGGSPSVRNALYGEEYSYLAPEQALQTEQERSLLANSGVPVGTTAYNNAMGTLERQQTFANQQAINNAITGATGQEAQLQGINMQGLGAQQAAGTFGPQLFSMMSGQGAPGAYAGNTDIMNAFQNQYAGQLNAANASNAANNQAVGDASSLAAAYLMFLAASDERLKKDKIMVGATDGGLPIYSFRYKGESSDAERSLGVMAQDVEKVRPDAVFTDYLGRKLVNYDKVK